MVKAMMWNTVLVVSGNKIILGGGSNLLISGEEVLVDLTSMVIQERIITSTWGFVSHLMVLTIWSLEIGMLFLYRRLKYAFAYGLCSVVIADLARDGLKQKLRLASCSSESLVYFLVLNYVYS